MSSCRNGFLYRWFVNRNEGCSIEEGIIGITIARGTQQKAVGRRLAASALRLAIDSLLPGCHSELASLEGSDPGSKTFPCAGVATEHHACLRKSDEESYVLYARLYNLILVFTGHF